jgi:hypothetical protein
MKALQDLPIGHVTNISGKMVRRWANDEFTIMARDGAANFTTLGDLKEDKAVKVSLLEAAKLLGG